MRPRSCCSCSRGRSAPTTCPTAATCATNPVVLDPGTNMPRMLSALEETKRNGGHGIAVNPLPEAGLIRFKNPQKVSGVLGRGTPIADQFLHIKPCGDLALFQAIK